MVSILSRATREAKRSFPDRDHATSGHGTPSCYLSHKAVLCGATKAVFNKYKYLGQFTCEYDFVKKYKL